jgi:hypothetical protein
MKKEEQLEVVLGRRINSVVILVEGISRGKSVHFIFFNVGLRFMVVILYWWKPLNKMGNLISFRSFSFKAL